MASTFYPQVPSTVDLSISDVNYLAGETPIPVDAAFLIQVNGTLTGNGRILVPANTLVTLRSVDGGSPGTGPTFNTTLTAAQQGAPGASVNAYPNTALRSLIEIVGPPAGANVDGQRSAETFSVNFSDNRAVIGSAAVNNGSWTGTPANPGTTGQGLAGILAGMEADEIDQTIRINGVTFDNTTSSFTGSFSLLPGDKFIFVATVAYPTANPATNPKSFAYEVQFLGGQP